MWNVKLIVVAMGLLFGKHFVRHLLYLRYTDVPGGGIDLLA